MSMYIVVDDFKKEDTKKYTLTDIVQKKKLNKGLYPPAVGMHLVQ